MKGEPNPILVAMRYVLRNQWRDGENDLTARMRVMMEGRFDKFMKQYNWLESIEARRTAPVKKSVQKQAPAPASAPAPSAPVVIKGPDNVDELIDRLIGEIRPASAGQGG